MIYYNPLIAALFAGLQVLGYLYFASTCTRRDSIAFEASA